jgi:prepilin-type processing-associated H-X9-DG protein
MVGEAKRDVPWTKAEGLPFDSKGPLPELGGFTPNNLNVAFVDGSVRTISNTINRTVLKNMITRAGDEMIRLEDGPDPQPKPAPAKP